MILGVAGSNPVGRPIILRGKEASKPLTPDTKSVRSSLTRASVAMRRPKIAAGFTLRPVTVTEHGFTYETFALSGWMNGKRIRRQFSNREEAFGEKSRLEVQAVIPTNPSLARTRRGFCFTDNDVHVSNAT